MERHGNRAPLPSRCPPASAGGFYANGAFPREAPSRLNKSPERKRRDTGTTPPAVDILPRVHGRMPVFRVQTARQDAVRSTSGRRPAKRLHEDRHSPVEAAGCRCFACIQCQRLSQPRRQKMTTIPMVVATMIAAATRPPYRKRRSGMFQGEFVSKFMP